MNPITPEQQLIKVEQNQKIPADQPPLTNNFIKQEQKIKFQFDPIPFIQYIYGQSKQFPMHYRESGPVKYEDNYLLNQIPLQMNIPIEHYMMSQMMEGKIKIEQNIIKLEKQPQVKNIEVRKQGKKINKTIKPRKIRKTVTMEKVSAMNKIFAEYTQKKQKGNAQFTLKSLCDSLELGYSTVLHKYRQFRSNQKVSGGALMSCLQRKRKYKKSIMVQKIIENVLKEKQFYSAVELAAYLKENYDLSFSRSIISRHLGQMGYSYNNLRIEKNGIDEIKYKQVRKLYAQILLPLIQKNEKMIYLDEATFNINEFKEEDVRQSQSDKQQIVSVILVCTIYGVIFYYLHEGVFTRQLFFQVMKTFLRDLRNNQNCKSLQGSKSQLLLIMDMNYIHRDDSNKYPGINNLLIQNNVKVFFLPPNSSNLNPIQDIFSNLKQKLKLDKIDKRDKLSQRMQFYLQQIMMEPMAPYFATVAERLHIIKYQQQNKS